MIWASPVTLTLTQIVKVISQGDANITRVLGMGMPISLLHRHNEKRADPGEEVVEQYTRLQGHNAISKWRVRAHR